MTDRPTTRRAVVRTLALWGAAVAVAPARALAARPRPGLAVGLVLGPGAASSRAGVELGAEEAARTAALIGGQVRLESAPRALAASDPARAAAELVERGGVHALVGGETDEAAAALARVARERDVPFLNVGATADALRRAECDRRTFHVQASRRMLEDALRLGEREGVRAVLWDPSLHRYGATQLNDRFRHEHGRDMDGDAWAGWFALQTLWECAARAPTPGAVALARALASRRFDGHKGRRLSFREWDGQLRQPLWLVPAGRVGPAGPAGPAAGDAEPVEVPRAAPGEHVDADALLDRLGAPPRTDRCPGGAR